MNYEDIERRKEYYVPSNSKWHRVLVVDKGRPNGIELIEVKFRDQEKNPHPDYPPTPYATSWLFAPEDISTEEEVFHSTSK